MKADMSHMFPLCILVRLLLAAAAAFYDSGEAALPPATPSLWRPALLAFLAAAAGAWTLMSLGIISRDKGIEAPEGVVWWQWLRPLHALMYANAFSFLVFGQPPQRGTYAAAVLVLDVSIGLISKYSR